MKFCEACGTRLRPKILKTESEAVTTLACDRCGFYVREERLTSKSGGEGDTQIKVVGEDVGKLQAMPTTKVPCPKCGHDEAFWWLLQTRGGDEPTTQFHRCTSCNHTWRVYP